MVPIYRQLPVIAHTHRSARYTRGLRITEYSNYHYSDMNWRRLELSPEIYGLFVLVKGGHRRSDRSFYAIGRIIRFPDGSYELASTDRFDGQICPTCRMFRPDICDYYYININEIK